jgi:hypothetical protein
MIVLASRQHDKLDCNSQHKQQTSYGIISKTYLLPCVLQQVRCLCIFDSAANIDLYILSHSFRPSIVSEVNLLRDIGFDSTKHSGGFGLVCTAATLNEHVKGSVVTPTKEY